MSILDRFRLDGRAAVITGGARGIGAAAAQAFAEVGCNVALIDMNIERATETAKKIAADTGVKTMALKADVTDPEDVNNFVKAVTDRFGRLDVAFCNAGTGQKAPAEELSYDAWKKVIDVNLNGIFLCAQAAAKVMLEQGHGSIINTASMSAHIVNVPQKQCNYNASKAAVLHLTKSMAVEFAPRGVRVNSISPGYIVTELISQSPLLEEWKKMNPIGRLGVAEDLQAAILYLASDASSYTTGCDIIIDGGYTCV